MKCVNERCPNQSDNPDGCVACQEDGAPCANGTRGCEGPKGRHPCSGCVESAADAAEYLVEG